jgi:glycosyltransferase involved in cell wall biosynthesis
MISTDKSLVGGAVLGDVISRHRTYGEQVDRLDIIVQSSAGHSPMTISDHVATHPTNSTSRLWYVRDSVRIARRLLAAGQYDLVVTQDPFLTGLAGVRIARRCGAKLLVHFHGDFWDNPHWLAEAWWHGAFLQLSRYVVARATALRVVSDGIKQKLISAGISSEKISVISTPVPITAFTNIDLGQPADPVVVSVGRLVAAKDYPTLLAAARLVHKKIPNLQWKIAGDGPLSEELRATAADQSYIAWLGLTSYEQLPALYAQASVVCLTSTNESFGKVIVEANAAGRPVVATATTGASELIRDGENGYLAPIGDATAIADKIIELLNDSNRAREMGEAGRQLMQEQFGKNAEKVIALWRSIVVA